MAAACAPGVELAQLLGAVGVVDRQHGHAMADGDESLDRLAADALRGAVRRDQLRMLGLDLLQLLEQAVELAVGNLRFGLDVVFLVVVIDELPEFIGHFWGESMSVAVNFPPGFLFG